MKTGNNEMECKAGTKKTIHLGMQKVPMVLAWCPPGTFSMGSANGQPGEQPLHGVTLTKGFWMAETPVTEAQWEAVMGTTFREQMYEDMPSWLELTGWRGPSYPMGFVNWEEARAFCEKAGQGLRLPTEAEWEYACRAGGTGDFGRPSPGERGRPEDMGWFQTENRLRDWLCDLIQKRAISKGPTWWLMRFAREFLTPHRHPVAKKTPNAWGLFDMHGNVQEWCADWHDGEYYAKSPSVDPQGPSVPCDKYEYRVCRGGDSGSRPEYGDGRAAFRGSENHLRRNEFVGFRPVAGEP